jgi:hypothetical protein
MIFTIIRSFIIIMVIESTYNYNMIYGYLNQTLLNKMDYNTDKLYCLAITSNKKLYNGNDSITVNIKNIVNNTLVFPDSSLGIKVENIKTNECLTQMKQEHSKYLI